MAIRIRFPAEEPPPVELHELSAHRADDEPPRRRGPAEAAGLAPFVRRVRSRAPETGARRTARPLSILLGPPAPAPFAFPEGEPQELPYALAEVAPRDPDLQWTLEMLVEEFLPRRGLTRKSTPIIRRDRARPPGAGGTPPPAPRRLLDVRVRAGMAGDRGPARARAGRGGAPPRRRRPAVAAYAHDAAGAARRLRDRDHADDAGRDRRRARR